METTKELLLFVATSFVGVGATQLQENIWVGVGVMLIGCAVFIARGFYKKYVGEQIAGRGK